MRSYLSLRWAGYQTENAVSCSIEERLPGAGMTKVHTLEFRTGDRDLRIGLSNLMDEVFQRELLIAVDLDGHVLASGDAVWDCEAEHSAEGVYLGVDIPARRLRARWSTHDMRHDLVATYGRRTAATTACNLAAFIERVAELERQGRRPLISVQE